MHIYIAALFCKIQHHLYIHLIPELEHNLAGGIRTRLENILPITHRQKFKVNLIQIVLHIASNLRLITMLSIKTRNAHEGCTRKIGPC